MLFAVKVGRNPRPRAWWLLRLRLPAFGAPDPAMFVQVGATRRQRLSALAISVASGSDGARYRVSCSMVALSRGLYFTVVFDEQLLQLRPAVAMARKTVRSSGQQSRMESVEIPSLLPK